MLRIECYPVLDGVAVAVVGIGSAGHPAGEGVRPSRVQRTIPVETMESLGLDEALRDTIVDIVVLYPGLMRYALQ